jgi:hypothetical protein
MQVEHKSYKGIKELYFTINLSYKASILEL